MKPQQAIDSLVVEAIDRLEKGLTAQAPGMADRAARWMRELAGSESPADYFLQPDRFPVLQLPWWLETSAAGAPDVRFQSRLAHSTVSGYYFIRLMDNVMDAQGAGDPSLLPLLGFFHTHFQSPYQELFPSEHPFWEAFRSIWFGSAEAAFRDAGLEAVDREQFFAVSAQKVSAVRIPLVAVGHRLDLGRAVEPWLELTDRLGRFEQFMDDLFDWQHDLASGSATYFLTEARSRKAPDESVTAWVVRDGFEWGVGVLQAWLDDVEDLAHPLGSPDLDEHLRGRRRLLLERRAQIAPVFESLQELASAFGGG